MFSRILYRSMCLREGTRLSSLCSKCSNCHTATQRALSTPSKWHGMWEPDDLKLEPDVPEYESLNIQMKGYDYPALESFAKYIHNTTKTIFNFENEAWPCPAKSIQVRTFRPRSTVVNEKYDIYKYERVVSVEEVPSTRIPLLVQFLRKHTPKGVEITLKEPDPEEDDQRYVPDYNVLELKAQREILESGKLVKKKKN